MIKRFNNFKRKYGGNLFQSILTFIDNSLVFVFNKEAKRSPLSVGWILTYKCNSKCSYCTSWKRGLEDKTQELTTEEAKDAIRQMGKLKVWMLSFTGGEPLLRKDIFDLIKEAKKNKIGTNINTNASLLDNYAEAIIDSGLDTITISVESYDSKIHNEIRNFENSFELLEKGLKKLNQLREKTRSKKPYIMVRANVNKKNYKDLEKYFEYWKDLSDEVVIQPIHEGGDNSIFHIQKQGIDFNEEDKKDYKNHMKKLFKKYPFLNKGYYKEFYNFFFNRKEMAKKYRCFAGYFILVLDPYGDVYPCAELRTKFGNIKENSLIDIINNEKSKSFKRILKNKENKCFCWYNCTGPINYPLTKIFNWVKYIKI